MMQEEDTQSEDLEVLTLLEDYPAPEAGAGFFEHALVRATHEGNRRQRNRWLLTGFGAAIAAGLTLFFVSGFLLGGNDLPTPGSDESIPGVTMALEETQTVRLVFASAVKLQDATLTVVMPEGVELAGYPAQREVSWQTSLAPGQNLLPLNLIATSPNGGEVLATLQHEDRSRTFRLRVDVS